MRTLLPALVLLHLVSAAVAFDQTSLLLVEPASAEQRSLVVATLKPLAEATTPEARLAAARGLAAALGRQAGDEELAGVAAALERTQPDYQRLVAAVAAADPACQVWKVVAAAENRPKRHWSPIDQLLVQFRPADAAQARQAALDGRDGRYVIHSQITPLLNPVTTDRAEPPPAR